MKEIIVRNATAEDARFAVLVSDEMMASAIIRGSGISRRSPESIAQKMKDGKAVIALTGGGEWVGFSYIEVWAAGEFVSNSGLIVAPAYRGAGVARRIKQQVFELSRSLYPDAKIFSITTGLAIMKMNSALGFMPVTYSEIPQGKEFWKGCESCVNYDILQQKKCGNCLCTAMLFRPVPQTEHEKIKIPEL